MAEGDTSSGGPERRLRRVEPHDPVLIRRAEEAEATVRTLEGHVADLRRDLREAEHEQRRTVEQLAEREHELRRVKQREYAEQQLRVETEEQRERLERGQRSELDRLQQRLAAGERHARELSDRLEIVRRELSEAEQAAVTGRAAARRAEEVLIEREAALARRELELEQQLEGVGRTYAKLAAIVRELKALVLQLRSISPPVATPAARAASAAPVQAEPDREEMAKALAAAVARLRARVAPPVEPEEQPEVERAPEPAPELGSAEPESGSERAPAPGPGSAEPESGSELGSAPGPGSAAEPESGSTPESATEPEAGSEPESAPAPAAAPAPAPFSPRVLALTARRQSWLAPAIRRVAERRDPKLAGELICELLPAQRLVVRKPLTYTLRIEGLGEVQVRLDGERTTVRRPSAESAVAAAGGGPIGVAAGVTAGAAGGQGDFVLEGPAAAFAELAAGGVGRRLTGVKVRGRRRRVRRLLVARRAPLALSDLAEADVHVWPGLLLLALSEAIYPDWTRGESFVLAFAIAGPPSATLYVQVRDGLPLAVTRVRGEQPLATVHLSERACLCMFSGAPLPPGEQVLVEGPTEPLSRLLDWSDRAQGIAS